ncbi:MAG: hypothetical protein ABIS28_20075 [Caldimonas sp.]
MTSTRAQQCAVGLFVLASIGVIAAETPDEQAQFKHAQGTCGSLGPGTGLREGKGWIVSMLPGRHEVRVVGGGSVYLTVAKRTSMDFDVGRPYYIVVEGTGPRSILEWKTTGRSWSAVPMTFLYPPQGVTQKQSDPAETSNAKHQRI